MNNSCDLNGPIRSYLRYLNNSFQKEKNKTHKKAHVLIVEGPSDVKLYRNTFESGLFVIAAQSYSFEFDSPRKCVSAFSKDYFHMVLGPKHGKINNVEFVISLLKNFQEMKSVLENIDCFGFIDRDFGHDIGSIVQLEKTTEHDGETNLIRCYMPDYFKKIRIDKDEAIDLFIRCVSFSLNQGILEKTSFDYEKECLKNGSPYQRGDWIEFSHSHFKRESENIYMGDLKFEDYIVAKGVSSNEDFMKLYKKNHEEFAFFSDFKDVLKRWLKGQTLEVFEEKRLSKILSYCNGHILVNQLVKCDEYLFNYDENPHFDHDILVKNLLSLMSKYPHYLLNLMPLKSYAKFRVDNDYIYKR